jgi:hypothetical protein
VTTTEIESSVRQLLREQEQSSKELANMNRKMSAIAAQVLALSWQKKASKAPVPWWRELAGKFDGDPVFAQVVREGRKWRNAQRNKTGTHRAHP